MTPVSNLFHKRERAFDTREPVGEDEQNLEMDGHKFAAGCSEIQTHVTGFEYNTVLNIISDYTRTRPLYDVSQNGYEKLQIFRLFDLNVQNSVIQKFINETYHIENELICQLDPDKFDTIPEYVIEECNKLLVATAS